jgi:plastocyanin
MTRLVMVVAGLSMAACGGGSRPPMPQADPPPTGTVIEVRMVTDEMGNRFQPARITAHRGDVIRFSLGSGVHSIHFPPDRNRDATGLPEASLLLHLPDQVVDVPVRMPPGDYAFQCDPHVALGMVGTLVVR